MRRLIARVTAHSDAHRAEVDGRLADALLALQTTVSQLLGTSSEQLAGRARLDGHLRRLAERSLMAEKISGAQLETLSTLLHELDAELRAVPYMSDPTLLITTDAQGVPPSATEGCSPAMALIAMPLSRTSSVGRRTSSASACVPI